MEKAFVKKIADPIEHGIAQPWQTASQSRVASQSQGVPPAPGAGTSSKA